MFLWVGAAIACVVLLACSMPTTSRRRLVVGPDGVCIVTKATISTPYQYFLERGSIKHPKRHGPLSKPALKKYLHDKVAAGNLDKKWRVARDTEHKPSYHHGDEVTCSLSDVIRGVYPQFEFLTEVLAGASTPSSPVVGEQPQQGDKEISQLVVSGCDRDIINGTYDRRGRFNRKGKTLFIKDDGEEKVKAYRCQKGAKVSWKFAPPDMNNLPPKGEITLRCSDDGRTWSTQTHNKEDEEFTIREE